MINDNPLINIVVFEFKYKGSLETGTGRGETQNPHCIELIWNQIQSELKITGETVRRIYSEWQPSEEDTKFIDAFFPNAKVTFSFSRPTDGNWERAAQEAQKAFHDYADKETSGGGSKSWWKFWN